jgi:hypothetical protein
LDIAGSPFRITGIRATKKLIERARGRRRNRRELLGKLGNELIKGDSPSYDFRFQPGLILDSQFNYRGHGYSVLSPTLETGETVWLPDRVISQQKGSQLRSLNY